MAEPSDTARAELLASLRAKPDDHRMREAAEIIEQLLAENGQLRRHAGMDGAPVAGYVSGANVPSGATVLVPSSAAEAAPPTPPTALANELDFFVWVTAADYRDFLNDPADLRRATHCMMSLLHLADWIVDRGTCARHGLPAAKTASELLKLAAADCPDLAWMRDVGNAMKHLRLDRPLAGTTGQVPSATGVVVASTAWGMGSYGTGPYGGTPSAKVGSRHLSHIARNVFHYWRSNLAPQLPTDLRVMIDRLP